MRIDESIDASNIDASWGESRAPERDRRVLAHHSAGRRNVVGMIHNIQPRQEGKQNILDFRVERFDASGNRLPPMPVELRAKKSVGALNEGDWVRVRGKWKEGRTRVVKRVRDITTDTDVGAKRHVVRTVFLLVLLVLFVVTAAAVVIAANSGEPVLFEAAIAFGIPVSSQQAGSGGP